MIPAGADMDGSKPAHQGDVVLGEDWIGADAAAESEARAKRDGRGVIAMNRSPLARKIITFNLLPIIVLVVGVLFLNPFRDGLDLQGERAIASEAELVAGILGARQGLATEGLADTEALLGAMPLPSGASVFVFDEDGGLVSTIEAPVRVSAADQQRPGDRSTIITDFLDMLWGGVAMVFGQSDEPPAAETGNAALVNDIVRDALANGTAVRSAPDLHGNPIFTAAAPIMVNGQVTGAVALASVGNEIDDLARAGREQLLQMVVIAILVSVGLSLVLASTVANPLSDLAAAAEIGREKNARKFSPSRVRIPDLTARPDEIGRLSGALRGMVAALYDRIDANEQFAADVAHEIKNPLASLRSAVTSLRTTQREDHRAKLLDVIEHDTVRLDRLVSDISNASRLDSELVKEEEAPFDLLKMIGNLADYLGNEAREKGVEFITDMPSDAIVIEGLESRLAQVFVNLLTNAISFCDDGDAIRVWVRKRENRVLVVVEDTGPGIPEQALTKIFNRFYTERPVDHFGNNSGLGLAISKQIVEAHGGVIWAENIRPTDADVTSEPLGARFVVGLPV